MDRCKSKKSKSIEAHQHDIISDLPKEVLYKVMERLPIRDAARMSLLSQKWQDIWTSIPHLCFDRNFFLSLKERRHKTYGYTNIVSNILFHHEGPILRFSMDLPLNPSLDIAPWISYLIRNGLKELILSDASRTNLKLNFRHFSCCGLETLKLAHCRLSGPPNFKCFPKLVIIELVNVVLSCNTFKVLMGNCSVLQKLNLTNCSGLECTDVLIDAPQLQVLILDWNFQSLELKCCENLVSASIGISSSKVRNKTSIHGLLKAVANSTKLERLCLRGQICRVFLKQLSLHTAFVRLSYLEFQSLNLDSLNDFSSLISCLQSFSNIQTLKINVITSTKLDEHVLDFNLHSTILYQLRFATIEFSCCFNPELKLIEFLLVCSPVLEKLLVLPTKKVTQSFMSKILLQLNRFRRASPKVEVIVLEPKISIDNVSSSSSSEDSSSS